MMHLLPTSLQVASAPNDITKFARASCIINLHFFGSMTRQTIQESIKVGQRVQVVSEEQQGWIGHPISITDGIALLTRNTDDTTPHLQIPLRCLMPAYRPSNHVKYWWADSHGIISSIDDNLGTISFVEKDTHQEVSMTILATTIDNISLLVPHLHKRRGAIHAPAFILPVYSRNMGPFQRAQRLRATQASRLYYSGG